MAEVTSVHLHRSSHTLGRTQERGSGGWDDRWSNSCVQCLFQESDFAGDLEDSKSTSGGVLCIIGSSMDGLPGLDLWNIVIGVLRSTNYNVQPELTSIQETGATHHSKTKVQKVKRRQKVDQFGDVDYVPTNTHSSQKHVSVVHVKTTKP